MGFWDDDDKPFVIDTDLEELPQELRKSGAKILNFLGSRNRGLTKKQITSLCKIRKQTSSKAILELNRIKRLKKSGKGVRSKPFIYSIEA
ncbi:MAG: hypothetical protein HOO06_13725 [Bdellovibrionaceae bacterium]|jgi:Fic family protein|nr:hypothetical protein [Pseudobdellovibrionaceae bacterium]